MDTKPLTNPAALHNLLKYISDHQQNAHYTLSSPHLHGELQFTGGTLGKAHALTCDGPLSGQAALSWLLGSDAAYPLELQQMHSQVRGRHSRPATADDDIELQLDPELAALMPSHSDSPESTIIIPGAFWTATQQTLNRSVGPAAMSLVRRSARKHTLHVGENLTLGQARTLHKDLLEQVSPQKRPLLETQFTQLLARYNA